MTEEEKTPKEPDLVTKNIQPGDLKAEMTVNHR